LAKAAIFSLETVLVVTMVEIKKIKKHWFFLSCLFVIGVAAFLRLYKLGNVPHGMTWDEAAIGYNGFAVLTTRRDEWLIHFPISFKSLLTRVRTL